MSLVLAGTARYAETNYGYEPMLSPIYGNFITFFLPDPPADAVPTFRPMSYFSFQEEKSVLFTYLLGVGLSILAASYSFRLLRNGYDVGAMTSLFLGIGSAVVWDIGIGLGLAIVYLLTAFVIKRDA